MKLSACAGILLCTCLLPMAATAADNSDTTPPSDTKSDADNGGIVKSVDDIARELGVPSLVLGASYDQGTFKMYNSSGRAQLTDNGRSAPVLEFVSPEHAIATIPMKYGNAVWGLNFTGSFGEQDTAYQNVPGGSGIIGRNIGSSVHGDYLAAAPFLYLRLGPIYPGSDSYWLFGYGLGGAWWHFSGNPVFYSTEPDGSTLATSMPISSTNKFFLYQTWRWQFHFGNFDIRFEGQMLDHHKINGYTTTYENYGLGVAYTIHF